MLRFLESPVTVYVIILGISLLIGSLFSKLLDNHEHAPETSVKDTAEPDEPDTAPGRFDL